MNRRGFLKSWALAPLAIVFGIKAAEAKATPKPIINDAWYRIGLFNNSHLDHAESILQSVKRRVLIDRLNKLPDSERVPIPIFLNKVDP